ncbi:helix-turn-helix domain-containing protein [Microbaculum marinum]|uniref:Helix-turn-helix domain-containing protein n=1 Tax=Microbaculum marinum TaxID=1764581 RepID=A0AAW9S362_9HYPH
MTPFGARLRAMRQARGVTLSTMAADLGVSSAYLSALEHGRRGRPPWHLVQGVIAYFNVIWDEAEELARLAELSHPRVTVDTAGLAPEATELANLLARDIARLTREDAADLVQRLKRATGSE